MKRRFPIYFLVFFISLFQVAWAQELSVSGKVTDKSSGNGLESVSVVVKGSNVGTKTDKGGVFKIKAPTGSVLIFSFIGMETQEVQVLDSKPIKVTLSEKSTQMEEVVVIGYGTQKKSVVTGAIASVKAKDLEDMPVARVEDALKGRTSGVTVASTSGQPGASATIMVRGVTSINNSDPLFVVDGVPVYGGIDYINSSDIESIEVLKDAASAAIYGTKAASGVILVSTKKGKAGKMQVNFNMYYGTQAPARKLDLLNATQYATLRNESSIAAGNGVVFANPASLGVGTDWQGQIFNNDARIQNYELSFSGGNEKSTYNASFGYFSQDGIVATPVSNYKRFSARFNSAHKLSSWLSFGNNIAYAHTKSMGVSANDYFGGPLASAVNLDPVTPVLMLDQNIIATNPTYANHLTSLVRNANGDPYAISQYVGQEMTNPMAWMQTQLGNYGWGDKFVGNVYLEIEPIKNFKLKSSIGGDMAFWGNESFTPIYFLSNTNSNLTNTSFNRGMNKAFNWIFTNTATYARSFGLHNVTAMIGTEAQNAGNQFGVNGTYLGIPVNTFGDASMNFATAPSNTQSGGYESQPYTLSSIFARATYDYAGKYMATAVFRRDGSSHFGSNNVYGNFPSISAGWIPSRENFWPSNKVVSYLKVRAGYGVNGNDNLSPFQFVSTIGGIGSYVLGNNQIITGYGPSAPANPNLKWEQTSQANFAVDAILFKDFSLTVDLFQKKTTGMLMTVKLPGYVGASASPWGNIASMENKGIEIELGYKKNIGKVNIDLKGNASYIKNKVTDIGANDYITYATFQASSYEVSRKVVGQPINEFYGFQTKGIFQTQAEVNSYVGKTGTPIQPNAKPGDFRYADLDGDGAITSKDRTYIGNPIPTWIFGFTASATYKNFDVRIFGQGAAGNKVFQQLRRLDITTANYQTKAMNRWTGPGTSYDYPRLVDGDPNGNFSNPSNFYLEDGAYFRIKTLQLGYTFSKGLLGKTGIQACRVYVSGNNLLTFTKYSGFDPEIGGGIYSIDRGVYPQARSFMAGLNVTF